MPAYIKKIDILRNHMAAGHWDKALALAAKWPRLGEQKQAIQRGHAAQVDPAFYEQLGYDSAALVATGKAALEARYGIR